MPNEETYNEFLSAREVAVNGRILPHYWYEELDSTNNEAMRRIAEGPIECALFSAEGQTAGRGQYRRSFYSSAGGNGLYLTFVWGPAFPEIPPREATLRMALLAARELESWAELAGLRREIRIKPVNDLYLGERKIAGILWERFRRHHVVGIGINVFPAPWPEELHGTAGALFAEKLPFPRADRIRSFWERLDGGLFSAASDEDERELRKRMI